jgi:hypothetical protein
LNVKSHEKMDSAPDCFIPYLSFLQRKAVQNKLILSKLMKIGCWLRKRQNETHFGGCRVRLNFFSRHDRETPKNHTGDEFIYFPRFALP